MVLEMNRFLQSIEADELIIHHMRTDLNFSCISTKRMKCALTAEL